MDKMIEGVKLYPLKRIPVEGGDVLHALKYYDDGFCGFGEAYFSTISYGAIKGWKRHNRFRLNIIVPFGTIKFVIYDDRPKSPTNGLFEEIILSPDDNYNRLVIEPGLWVAFQGLAENVVSILLDIIPEVHDPYESDRRDINNFRYQF